MGTVQAVVRYPDGTAWPFARVDISLLGVGMLPDGTVTAGIAHKLTDATGAVSFDLPANRPGEFYVWINPDGSQVTFGPVTNTGTSTLANLATNVGPIYQGAVTQQQLAQEVAEAVADAIAAGGLGGGGGGGGGGTSPGSVFATDMGDGRILLSGTGVLDRGDGVIVLNSPDITTGSAA